MSENASASCQVGGKHTLRYIMVGVPARPTLSLSCLGPGQSNPVIQGVEPALNEVGRITSHHRQHLLQLLQHRAHLPLRA